MAETHLEEKHLKKFERFRALRKSIRRFPIRSDRSKKQRIICVPAFGMPKFNTALYNGLKCYGARVKCVQQFGQESKDEEDLKQLEWLTKQIKAGIIGKNNHILFLNDIWFIGLEFLDFLRKRLGRGYRIVGYWHRGVIDALSDLSRIGLRDWVELERGMLKIVDRIFCGISYISFMLIKKYKIKEKMRSVGIIYDDWDKKNIKEGENLAVWPYKGQGIGEEYYTLLKSYIGDALIESEDITKGRIMVSFNNRKEVDYNVIDAIAMERIPIVPNRRWNSWCDKMFKVNNFEECVTRIKHILGSEAYYYLMLQKLRKYKRKLRRRTGKTIGKIIGELKKL